MAYSDVPLTIDETLSVSQPKIRTNFLNINTIISQDHVTFDGAAGEGKHKQVTMPTQVAHPTTTATEVNLYSHNNVAGSPALWFQPSNVLVADTAGVDFTTCLNAVNGWTRLPSGILLKWGQGSFTGGTRDSAITFPVDPLDPLAIPAFKTLCYAVTVTSLTIATGVYQDNLFGCTEVSKTGFTARRLDSSHYGTGFTFSYIAIGD